ncbi:hypothetical protein [Desulfovibrio aminophilus]|uniref:hypothetical protein n=1 Tax=Desulfovibrio aminophilus TaxID=81425 RepID=UPI003398FB5D
MSGLVMEFRRRSGTGVGCDVWHWCRSCRHLPGDDPGVQVRRLEPGDVPEEGELCEECAALGERMGCGLILHGE